MKLLLALLPLWTAAAQLQLSVAEQPVRGVLDLGTVETGEIIDTAFRIRNPGTAGVTLERLAAAGTGFTLRGGPQLPVTLLAGAFADFTVRFEPAAAGGNSAVLYVNSETFQLLANVRAGPVLSLEGGGVLASGAAVDFGGASRCSPAARRFTLSNPAAAEVVVTELEIAGDSFEGPPGLHAPLRLAPKESVSFEVGFAPVAEGISEGSLQLNSRRILLHGAKVAPPLPRPSLLLDPPAPGSGQQVRLSIRLAGPVCETAQGRVTLEFRGPADAAIGFMSPAGRAAPFEVLAGEDAARSELWFQTGTTAGTLVLSIQFGPHGGEVLVPLPPLPIALDTVGAARSGSGIEVEVAGFDNTRSASHAIFTFLDAASHVLGGGPLRVELAEDFRRYFAASPAGGTFALRAVFPVQGNGASIASVDVEMGNDAGAVRKSATIAP